MEKGKDLNKRLRKLKIKNTIQLLRKLCNEYMKNPLTDILYNSAKKYAEKYPLN